jgi:hypothetical protein
MAERLFTQSLPAVTDFTSPRAWAFSLIGIHEYLHHSDRDCPAKDLREDLTSRLVAIFDKIVGPGWTGFEDGLTYDKAKLAHALIVTGRETGQAGVCERGIQALRWLVGAPTSQRGQLRFIGNGEFYKRNAVRTDFDQQPIEAQSTISACLEAYRATDDGWWYEQAQCAFDWLLAWNDPERELYAGQTGGCRDSLHADRRNENPGTESMLAFLLSLSEMRLTPDTAKRVQRAGTAASINQ